MEISPPRLPSPSGRALPPGRQSDRPSPLNPALWPATAVHRSRPNLHEADRPLRRADGGAARPAVDPAAHGAPAPAHRNRDRNSAGDRYFAPGGLRLEGLAWTEVSAQHGKWSFAMQETAATVGGLLGAEVLSIGV
jgi:hypothetical protein